MIPAADVRDATTSRSPRAVRDSGRRAITCSCGTRRCGRRRSSRRCRRPSWASSPGSTTTVFPENNRINFGAVNGLRASVGANWDKFGVEVGGFALERKTETGSLFTNGTPVAVAQGYISAGSGMPTSLFASLARPVLRRRGRHGREPVVGRGRELPAGVVLVLLRRHRPDRRVQLSRPAGESRDQLAVVLPGRRRDHRERLDPHAQRVLRRPSRLQQPDRRVRARLRARPHLEGRGRWSRPAGRTGRVEHLHHGGSADVEPGGCTLAGRTPGRSPATRSPTCKTWM